MKWIDRYDRLPLQKLKENDFTQRMDGCDLIDVFGMRKNVLGLCVGHKGNVYVQEVMFNGATQKFEGCTHDFDDGVAMWKEMPKPPKSFNSESFLKQRKLLNRNTTHARKPFLQNISGVFL